MCGTNVRYERGTPAILAGNVRSGCLFLQGSRLLPVIKLQFYCIPLIKKMVGASPADAAILEPTDDLHEDPVVLPDTLGYLGKPNTAC